MPRNKIYTAFFTVALCWLQFPGLMIKAAGNLCFSNIISFVTESNTLILIPKNTVQINKVDF